MGCQNEIILVLLITEALSFKLALKLAFTINFWAILMTQDRILTTVRRSPTIKFSSWAWNSSRKSIFLCKKEQKLRTDWASVKTKSKFGFRYWNLLLIHTNQMVQNKRAKEKRKTATGRSSPVKKSPQFVVKTESPTITSTPPQNTYMPLPSAATTFLQNTQ